MKITILPVAACMLSYGALAAVPQKIDSASPNSYWGYRFGLDIDIGATTGNENFYYGIYDNSVLFGMELNFGLVYKEKLETELAFNAAISDSVDSPNNWGYYYTDMAANGSYYGFTLREHYYIPISEKWKFDVALGYGYYWERAIVDDTEDWDYIKPERIWTNDSSGFEIMVGLWWRFNENAALRFGYKRTNFTDSKFPIDNINAGYLGVSYIL